MTKSFLLEVGTEEIPARFMAPVLEQLREAAGAALRASRLQHGAINTLGTPRRLVLLVADLAEQQLAVTEKKKGPSKKAAYNSEGRPTPAALGFARGQGIDVNKLYTEAVDGVEYVFAELHEKGLATAEILPAICVDLLKALAFPKPMFWYSREIRFARPIRWLAALHGSDLVNFEFAGLCTDRLTRGHRFLSPQSVALANADDYLPVMAAGKVIVDPEERRKMITEQVKTEAARLGGRSTLDSELLEEVVHLVEHPRAVAGDFSHDFLEIPPEALITVMRAHQRYFPVFSDKGELLPHFIAVSNGTSEEFTGNVRTGNERVLRARLADARFFFEEDRKIPLATHAEALDNILFMEQLGSMREKSMRLSRITEAISRELGLSAQLTATAVRAAQLCKADLVTHMVYEFPELQGTMGGHYARLSGEESGVAVAVSEHYAPRFAGDSPPATLPGAAVSLADKLDTLVSCFGLGLIPSGSQDPYALRRSALGIVGILKKHNMTISLSRLVGFALAELSGMVLRQEGEVLHDVHDFLLQRARYLLAGDGLRYDVVDAVFGSTADDMPGLSARARVLQDKLDTPELTELLLPFTRAANLTRNIAPISPQPALFANDAERKLYNDVLLALKKIKEAAPAGDYMAVFAALAALGRPIDDFFTEVMVMVDDERIRNNRLALLLQVKNTFLSLGDLSKIVQEKNNPAGKLRDI